MSVCYSERHLEAALVRVGVSGHCYVRVVGGTVSKVPAVGEWKAVRIVARRGVECYCLIDQRRARRECEDCKRTCSDGGMHVDGLKCCICKPGVIRDGQTDR